MRKGSFMEDDLVDRDVFHVVRLWCDLNSTGAE
jgi:hypothetical protein